MTTGVILQPSYIPWRGYFHQIRRADVFVFYDDVAYDRRGWRNRNRIGTARGPIWLTVPVQYDPRGTPINRIRIDSDTPWADRHELAITLAYAKAPCLDYVLPALQRSWRAGHELLGELTIELTVAISALLDVGPTRFVRSSELHVGGSRTERLVRICQALGIDHYVTGPSAATYIEDEAFARAGISVEYMRYDYPEYRQLHMPYDPQLSIVDMLAMLGPGAGEYIWGASYSGKPDSSAGEMGLSP